MFRIIPQLTVSDIAQSVAFYQRHLGFRVTLADPEETPEFVQMEREDVSLFLVTGASREEAYQQETLKHNARGVGIRLYFEVDNARAVYDALQKAGVPILREIEHNEQEDYTEFSCADPDGYEIGVYS
jgi:catechol 2,3-dioxygenase-like lactoylglutathione lyase family enzyme